MTPWEERSDLLATVWGTLTDPGTLYRTVEKNGPTARAVVYGVLLGMIGLILGIAWQLVGTGLLDVTGLRSRPEVVAELGSVGPTLLITVLVITSPFFLTLSLYASAGIYHLALSLLGGARYGYDATLRATAYAQTAQLASVIPICGGLIAPIWVFVLIVVGLREVHETTTGRAVGAIVLPLVACCGLLALAIVIPLYLASR